MTYSWVEEPEAKGLEPGAVVLVGFPSAGLAGTVAGHYIVQTLKLPRTAVLSSPDLLPLAVIQSGRVQPPVRMYGRGDVGVVISEFPVLPDQALSLAEAILDGAEKRGARLVLSLEGVVPHPVEGDSDIGEDTVWAIQSRPDSSLTSEFDRAGARPLGDGVIGGASGALLIEGLHRKTPTATLLVSARTAEGYPDHRAGAVLIETLDRFLPHLDIDTGPLRSQAQVIEKALRAAMKSRTKADTAPTTREGDLPIYQ